MCVCVCCCCLAAVCVCVVAVGVCMQCVHLCRLTPCTHLKMKDERNEEGTHACTDVVVV